MITATLIQMLTTYQGLFDPTTFSTTLTGLLFYSSRRSRTFDDEYDDDMPEWRFDTVRVTTTPALSSLQEQITPPQPAAAAATQLTPSPPLQRERNSPVNSENMQELSNHSEDAESSPRPPSTTSGRETVFSSFSDVSIDVSEDDENISRVNGIIPEAHGNREERVSVNGIDEPPQEMETEPVQPQVLSIHELVAPDTY